MTGTSRKYIVIYISANNSHGRGRIWFLWKEALKKKLKSCCLLLLLLFQFT